MSLTLSPGPSKVLANEQQFKNVQTAIQARNKLKAGGADTSKVDQMIQELMVPKASVANVLPAVKDSPAQVGLNAAGTAADILTAGTYGKVKAAVDTAKDTKMLETILPKLGSKDYKATAKAGDIVGNTITKGAGVDTTSVAPLMDSVKRVASQIGTTAKDIIRTNSSKTNNYNRVQDTIGKFFQKAVTPFLNAHPVPFHFQDFIDYFKNTPIPPELKDDKATQKIFGTLRDKVQQGFADSLKAQSKNTGTFGSQTSADIVRLGRSAVDRALDEATAGKAWDDPVKIGFNKAARVLRNSIADFTSDMLRYPGQMEKVAQYRNTVNGMKARGTIELGKQELGKLAGQMGLKPTGEAVASTFDTMMKDSSNLYDVLENLGTHLKGEEGKKTLALYAERNPGIATAAKYVGGGLAAGLGIGGAGEIAKKLMGQ